MPCHQQAGGGLAGKRGSQQVSDTRAYLRAREIAELLGVDIRTVKRRIKDGTFPSIKLGGARLVCKHALLRILQAD